VGADWSGDFDDGLGCVCLVFDLAIGRNDAVLQADKGKSVLCGGVVVGLLVVDVCCWTTECACVIRGRSSVQLPKPWRGCFHEAARVDSAVGTMMHSGQGASELEIVCRMCVGAILFGTT
jgi:hypothetical protein